MVKHKPRGQFYFFVVAKVSFINVEDNLKARHLNEGKYLLSSVYIVLNKNPAGILFHNLSFINI